MSCLFNNDPRWNVWSAIDNNLDSKSITYLEDKPWWKLDLFAQY